MVVLVITGLRAALEMTRVARVRVICKRCSGAPKRHGQRQHERRDQQRNSLPHLISPPLDMGEVAGRATGSARPL